jgi:hypothetical protein
MDYGVEVSRAGYNIDTASDKQLAFSSQWPLLPIEAEGTYSIASGSQTYTIYNHDLDYVPVFMCWEESGGQVQTMDASFRNVYADTDNLVYDGWAPSAFTLHYKVFRRELLKNYTAETINSTDATETDSGDFGLVVSLPGKDISSTDKRDFCIRSDVRQLMIHKTGYTTTPSATETITHNLGYKPMYWIFHENTERNSAGQWSLSQETDDFVASATTTQLLWTLFTAQFNWAYLIFKDPVNAVG